MNLSNSSDVLAERFSRAMNAVEDTLQPETQARAAIGLLTLMLDPFAGPTLAPLLALMSKVAVELAEATGRTPVEVIAEWRTRTAEALNDADEFNQRLRGERP